MNEKYVPCPQEYRPPSQEAQRRSFAQTAIDTARVLSNPEIYDEEQLANAEYFWNHFGLDIVTAPDNTHQIIVQNKGGETHRIATYDW